MKRDTLDYCLDKVWSSVDNIPSKLQECLKFQLD